MAKLGRTWDEANKLKLSANTQPYAIIATEISTGETKVFTSTLKIKAGEFIDIHYYYLTKCLNENNIYTGNRGYTIVKNN